MSDDQEFVRELVDAADRECEGRRPRLECDACGMVGCAGWCRRHPGNREDGSDRE